MLNRLQPSGGNIDTETLLTDGLSVALTILQENKEIQPENKLLGIFSESFPIY